MNQAQSWIDSHLQSFPEAQRLALSNLRQQIAKLAPGATERVSYSMPTFEISGEILIHFDGFKNHNSIFVGSEVPKLISEKLGDRVASKGTIKFGLTENFPPKLLNEILRLRIEQINASYPKKNGKYLSFYDNGHLKSKGKYRDGQMEGDWEFYRRDGSLMRKGRLRNGEPVGRWTTHTKAN